MLSAAVAVDKDQDSGAGLALVPMVTMPAVTLGPETGGAGLALVTGGDAIGDRVMTAGDVGT